MAQARHWFVDDLRRSFVFSRNTAVAMLYDLLHYAIAAGLVLTFFLASERDFAYLDEVKAAGQIGLEGLAELAGTFFRLKAYLVVLSILIIANWVFWRYYILKMMLKKKDSPIRHVLCAIVLAIARIVILAIMVGIAGVLSFLLKDAVQKIAMFIIFTICMHVYFAITFGLTSEEFGKKAWRATKSLLLHWKRSMAAILAGYAMLILISLVLQQAQQVSETAFIIGLPTAMFVYFGWLRNYFFNVAKRILGIHENS